jgi:hypothetical protein
LTDSSANTVGDKTIRAGIKSASMAPGSCDFFMVIHRNLIFAGVISFWCRLIIMFYLQSTRGRED